MMPTTTSQTMLRIMPRMRPALTFDSLEYGMPDARISFLALLPRYQAIGAKIVTKIPIMPKIRISVPCGCSRGGAP
jgi:hypothetical protein